MNKRLNQIIKFSLTTLLLTQLAACGGGGSDNPAPDGGGNGGTGNSVTLNWQAPTKNTNDTNLADLAGYKIYYGTSPLLTTSVVTVTNPGATSKVINGLSSGQTYYFVITAVNDLGVESSYSNTISKVL